MHEQPVLRRMGLFEGLRLPVSERLGRRGFYVPSGMALTEVQIDTVAAAVRELMS
jgi:perosamine synthetase